MQLVSKVVEKSFQFLSVLKLKIVELTQFFMISAVPELQYCIFASIVSRRQVLHKGEVVSEICLCFTTNRQFYASTFVLWKTSG